MSVWRMEMDISFDSKANMLAMMNLVETMYYRLQKLEGPLPIPCQVRWHECKHDEGLPCSGYQIVTFDGETNHGVPAEQAVPNQVKTIIKAPVEAEKAVLQGQIDTLKVEKTALVEEKATLAAEITELKAPKVVDKPTGMTGV